MLGGRRNDQETPGQLPSQGDQSPHPQLKTGSPSAGQALPCSSTYDLQVSPSAWRGLEGQRAAEADTVWASQPEHVEIIHVFK